MPLVYISAGFLLGVAVAPGRQLTPVAEGLGILVGLLVLAVSRWHPGLRLLALCLLAFIAGLWRFGATVEAYGRGISFTGLEKQQAVQMRGVVDAPPEMRELRQNILLAVKAVRVGGRWEEREGALLLFADLAPAFEYGDTVEIAGRLEEPPAIEGFDYREYLARQGISHVVQHPQIKLVERSQGLSPLTWIHRLRGRLANVLGSVLPEPEASLAQGILLGVRSSMPRDLLSSFSATGTTHILAISGYNITVIAGLLVAVATRLVGRNRATYTAVAGISFYALLAGASPSVLRATVMGVLVIAAYHLGRQSSVVNALALSAAALAAFRPAWLWDLGFQLSFLATAGLVVMARPLTALLLRIAAVAGVTGNRLSGELARFIIEGFAISLAATIYTLPLVAMNFHSIPLVSLVANLFAVPTLPPIIASTAAVALLGVLYLPLGQWAAYMAWPFLAYLVGVVNLFAAVPGASLPVAPVDPAIIWIYYTALGILTMALYVGRDGMEEAWLKVLDGWQTMRGVASAWASRFPATWTVPFCLAIAVVVWTMVFTLPDDRLQVTFLDVGQGDAILVKTPDNRKVLVDGGPSPQRLLNELGQSMPFWDRTIDVVILSHPDDDHLAGLLGVLDRYESKAVLEGPQRRSTSTYQTWQERIAQKGLRREVLQAGQLLRIGKLEIAIISVPQPPGDSPEQPNASLILRLRLADVSFLLPGDTPAGSQWGLLDSEYDLRSTILKVPHHGARDALDQRLLEAVDPQLAVISVGKDNPFGHPAPETLALLEGTRTLRTDEAGSIVAITDGKKTWISTRR